METPSNLLDMCVNAENTQRGCEILESKERDLERNGPNHLTNLQGKKMCLKSKTRERMHKRLAWQFFNSHENWGGSDGKTLYVQG